ncbi:MAG: extracellular solute-binding protein [Caldilineaceae bacterium]|nr:extracellular solute-binding protein [Caldilineaceae bacterium]
MKQSLSRRSFLQMTALSSLGVALAACAPAAPAAQPGAAAGEAPSAAAQPTQIRFHARIGVQGDYYTAMAEQFNAEHPDIEVIPENFPTPNPEYFQKISTMIAGGTIGDAMWAASIHNYYNYAAAGQYVALDDFIAADSYDLGQFYPVAIDACRFEGNMYGLPWIVHPGRIGLYYNQTAFEEAGLELPSADWTYDDLLEASLALTKQEGGQTTQWGFLPETDYFGLVIPIRSFGGDWMNAEGTQVTVDEEAAVAGLKMFEDIHQLHQVTPTPGQIDDKPQMWASGRVAMVQSGYWGQSWGKNFVKDFEWMVAPMPKGPEGSRGMFEFDPNVILATSKAPQAAWEFLKYLSTKEAGVKIAEAGSVPGGRPDVWEDEGLMSYEPHAVFTEIMKTIDPLVMPNNFRAEELFQVAKNVLDPVWLGEKKIDDVIGELASAMQMVMDQPRV